VLVMSVAEARRRGIDEKKWVYLHGAADAHDRWYVSDRVDYHSSPAIRAVGARALADAQVAIDEVDLFDLYSCFPAALEIARDELGIRADDPRPLTVTGGLPYHGGPGNNYSMHAIATMMDRLRASPGAKGLVTALGWYLTKHSVGVYSTEPPARRWPRSAPLDVQAHIDAMVAPVVVAEADGPAHIETYTVMHDRDGKPMSGIVIGRLDDDRRFVANLPLDAASLEGLTRREGVGVRGRVDSSAGVNIFVPN
jgi:acetyl-CoA C-acetyltransferase